MQSWFATTIGSLLLCAPLRLASAVDGPPPTMTKTAAITEERAWWNQDVVVADLALTGEQRTRMDALLDAALEQERDSRRKQRDANAKFEEALHQGDLQAARKAAPGLRAALGESWECKSTLMLDVLSVLNGEQRQKLLARHPGLLRQPWEDGSISVRRGLGLLPP